MIIQTSIETTISVFGRSLWVGRVAKNLVLRSFIVLTCLNNRLVPIFVAILSHYKHMVTSNTYLSTDTITRQAAKEPKSMALSFFDDFFESWELLIMINRGSWLSLYKLGMDKIAKLNGEQISLSKVLMEYIYGWNSKLQLLVYLMETLVLNLLLKNLVVCQNYTWRSNLLLNGPTVGNFFWECSDCYCTSSIRRSSN